MFSKKQLNKLTNYYLGGSFVFTAVMFYGTHYVHADPQAAPGAGDAQPSIAEDITPSSNAQPEATPTPEPTTEAPTDCQYLQLDLKNIGSGTNTDHRQYRDMLDISPELEQQFGCLRDWYNRVVASVNSYIPNSFYADDLIAKQAAVDFFAGDLQNITPWYRGVQEQAVAGHGWRNGMVLPNGATCQAVKHHHIGFRGNRDLEGNQVQRTGHGLTRYCSRGSTTLNAACEVVPATDQICGVAQLKWKESSPISLIWKDGVDIEQTISFVSFPLDSTVSGKWYAWKASADTPLLVYDPTHRGQITSASQLFGEWTFGGKKTAALNHALDSSILSDQPNAELQPWKDGYQALGSLDLNRDGEVSGDELAALALWFDNNQDGISQAGEVKRLDEVGVVALYYNSDYRNQVTRSLHAARGYRRVIDGKEVVRPSVDWYGEQSDSPHSLSMKYFLSAEVSTPQDSTIGQNDAGQEAPSVTEVSQDSITAAYNTPSLPTSGLWQWSYDDPAMAAELASLPQGYLLLTRGQKENQVIGYSVVNTHILKAPGSDAKSRLDFFFIDGEFIQDSGSRNLKFEVRMDRSAVLSQAKLSADGKTLNGSSTVHVRENHGFKKITYRWTAKKQ